MPAAHLAIAIVFADTPEAHTGRYGYISRHGASGVSLHCFIRVYSRIVFAFLSVVHRSSFIIHRSFIDRR